MANLPVAPQHVDDLVHIEFLHAVAGGSEVFARVELGGFLRQGLADGRRHRQAAVGVDVDLAHRRLRGFPELFLRDAYRRLEAAAVAVDDVNVFLRHRRRAVKHDGEAGKFFLDGFEDVERERRRKQTARLRIDGALLRRELVRAV